MDERWVPGEVGEKEGGHAGLLSGRQVLERDDRRGLGITGMCGEGSQEGGWSNRVCVTLGRGHVVTLEDEEGENRGASRFV